MDVKKIQNTYNKIAQDFNKDHQNDTWDDDFIEYFSNELFPEATILDFGCGPGTDSLKLSQYQFKIYGLDISEELLKIARQKNPEGQFIHGDILEKLPYQNNFFDGVFAKASLLHVPKEKMEMVIQEIIRILKKGGILHIAVKKGEGEKNIIENDYGYNYERFFSYWQPEELKEIFKKFNLNLLKEGEFKAKETSTWIKFLLKK